MRVIYHPDAEAEVLEAVQFYETRVSGLGQRLLREFEAAIADVATAPGQWPIIEDDIRRYLMRRFPYGILYRIEGDELRILAVKHHSRHPDYWKYRLSE